MLMFMSCAATFNDEAAAPARACTHTDSRLGARALAVGVLEAVAQKLPGCVTKEIADRYPDKEAKVGFKRSRFDF